MEEYYLGRGYYSVEEYNLGRGLVYEGLVSRKRILVCDGKF